MITQLISITFLIFGFYLLYKLNPIKVNPFLRKESKRGIYNHFKIENDWNSEGRVYSIGLTLIKHKNGKKEFIQQSKLVDSALLYN